MITKEQLSKVKGWHYINPSISSFPTSGWKLHIFGTTLDDSHLIGTVMEPLMVKYKLMMKIATQEIVDIAIGDPQHNQFGKAATLYITPALFKEEKIHELVKEIQAVLKEAGYTKEGEIDGDRSLDGIIHYRYELKYPIDPTVGLTYYDYIRAYSPNRGEYNIPNNPDIHHLLIK